MKKDKRSISKGNSGRSAAAALNQSELELAEGQFGLTRLDYIAVPVLAILAAALAFSYVGTTIEWDDLFYMNVSQHTTKQAWVLNRYGHIYLQKLFFWLSGDALTGAKLYWSFLFFSTCVLVYWCAKMLAGKRGYVVGVVAVLMFCSHPLFGYYLGTTFADTTVMFMVMLGTFVYLAFFVGRSKYRHLVIIILGLIFFWAVKSKDSGICMGVLFLGLGYEPTGQRSIKRFAKDIGWVAVGMLTGCVLLMMLDMIFLGDGLFSIRPSSIRRLFGYNTGEYIHDQKNRSWYTILSLGPIFLPFILYVLVGWKAPGRGLSRHEVWAWLIPLTILAFEMVASIRIRCGSTQRHIFPAIPGICVWGAQFFRFDIRGLVGGRNGPRVPKSLIGGGLVVSAFIVAVLITRRVPEFVAGTGWKSMDRFYDSVTLPLAVTVVLMSAGLSRKRGLGTLFVLSLCFFFVIYFPLRNNFTSMKQRVVAKKSEWRFEPYRVFADELRFGEDVKILVSKDIHERSWMLGRPGGANCCMFNVFFNQKFTYEQFIDGEVEDILKGDYTYAFLTWRDWKEISEKHDVEHLLKDYIQKSDNKTQIILLKKR